MKKVLFQAISLSFLWIVFMTFAALAEVQNNIEVGQMKNYRLNLWSKGIIYLVEMRQVGIPGIGIFSVRLKSGKKTLNWYEIPGEEAQVIPSFFGKGNDALVVSQIKGSGGFLDYVILKISDGELKTLYRENDIYQGQVKVVKNRLFLLAGIRAKKIFANSKGEIVVSDWLMPDPSVAIGPSARGIALALEFNADGVIEAMAKDFLLGSKDFRYAGDFKDIKSGEILTLNKGDKLLLWRVDKNPDVERLLYEANGVIDRVTNSVVGFECFEVKKAGKSQITIMLPATDSKFELIVLAKE